MEITCDTNSFHIHTKAATFLYIDYALADNKNQHNISYKNAVLSFGTN